VQVEVDVTPVADEDAVFGVDAALLEGIDLFEQTWDVDDTAGTDEVDAAVCQDAGCCNRKVNRLAENRPFPFPAWILSHSRKMCTSNVVPFLTIV
jgi:hypothetical protein